MTRIVAVNSSLALILALNVTQKTRWICYREVSKWLQSVGREARTPQVVDSSGSFWKSSPYCALIHMISSS